MKEMSPDDFINLVQEAHNARAEEAGNPPTEVHFILPPSCQRIAALSILAELHCHMVKHAESLHDNMPIAAMVILDSLRSRSYDFNRVLEDTVDTLKNETIRNLGEMVEAYRDLSTNLED